MQEHKTVPIKFHRYLIEGQESRNVSDYDVLGPDMTQVQAEEQLSRAAQFIELAGRLLDTLPPQP